ncbi:MAG: FHA domain-containing protein [Baekduia sp.]
MSGASPDAAAHAADPLARHAATPAELQSLLALRQSLAPFLAFRDGDGRLRLEPLAKDTRRILTIGRREDSDIVIAWDGRVSALHCELVGAAGTWSLRDDGLSTNGTYVNEQRVTRRRRLNPDDRIRVGHTVLAYEAPGPTLATTIAAGAQTMIDVSAAQHRVLVALCRPYFAPGVIVASPASNQQIADEIVIGLDAVKTHLRALFRKFELDDLPQGRKRAQLAECALQLGIVRAPDFTG